MSVFVLDCSIAVAWLFDDEAAPETDALLEQMKDSGALVPTLWRLELGNVLARAERRKRITATQIAAAIDLMDRLPIVTDTETDDRAFREILTLARTVGLTTYDAAYLELATRRGVQLATRDKTLIRAAHRLQVETLPG
jgi:predicted nucleic acid-binding protein